MTGQAHKYLQKCSMDSQVSLIEAANGNQSLQNGVRSFKIDQKAEGAVKTNLQNGDLAMIMSMSTV